MKTKLSNRLFTASSYISSSPIIDVGSDHGQLAIYLSSKGYKVYASENKIGPFNILKESILNSNSSVNCIFLDGIKDMPSEIKSVVILGMGGDTIYKILNEGKSKLSSIDEIIIEPQSSFIKPISFLYENNFKNVDGKFIFERKYYPILKFLHGIEDHQLNDLELNYGSFIVNNKDELLIKKLKSELNKLNSLTNSGVKKIEEITKLEKYLSILEN